MEWRVSEIGRGFFFLTCRCIIRARRRFYMGTYVSLGEKKQELAIQSLGQFCYTSQPCYTVHGATHVTGAIVLPVVLLFPPVVHTPEKECDAGLRGMNHRGNLVRTIIYKLVD